MSLVNKMRKDVNERHNNAHGLMQQAVALNGIIQSPEYLNCTTINHTYVDQLANAILNDFNNASLNLSNLDQRLNMFNNKQLTMMDQAGLINLDQEYIMWCDSFSGLITPAIANLVAYIQQFVGVTNV